VAKVVERVEVVEENFQSCSSLQVRARIFPDTTDRLRLCWYRVDSLEVVTIHLGR